MCITMAQNKSLILSFNRTSEGNKLTTLLSRDAEDYGKTYSVFSFLSLVCLTVVLSNSMLLHTIISKRKETWARQTKHIRYLIVCDLVVGVNLFLNITLRLFKFSKKYWVCAVLSSTSLSSQAASYYHMLAVCIHRFRKLRKIELPNGKDTYRYGAESIFIWIFVLLISAPQFVISGRKYNLPVCRLNVIIGPSDIMVTLIYVLTLFCLPCFLTNVLFGAVLCRMRFRLNTIQPANQAVQFRSAQYTNTNGAAACITIQPPSNQGVITRRSNKVNKVIGYLLLVLNISILSPIISYVMILVGYEGVAIGFVQQLTYINNVFSPFIYSLTIEPLRKELISTIRTLLSRVKSAIMCTNVQN